MPIPRRTAVRLLAALLLVLVVVLALHIAARDDGDGRPVLPEWLSDWIWWLLHATGLKKFEAPR